MRTKNIYLLAICSMLLCICNAQESISTLPNRIEQSGNQQAINTITEFYNLYLAENNTRDLSIDSIKKKYLTNRAIKKIRRIIKTTGADPVIRAQDYLPEALETLTVKHLEENWYLVSYRYSYNNDTTWIKIPLRILNCNNQYKIDYITPEWNKTMYGDSLLIDHPVINPIDDSNPLFLLKTFYEAYTTEYCSMPEDLSQRLQKLRKKFCTEKALEDFQEALEYAKLDGYPEFDLLIDGFDFDRIWIPSMTYRHISGDDYEVFYKVNESSFTIQLNVIKLGNMYRINGIKTKMLY